MTNVFNVTKNTDAFTGGAASDIFIVAGPTSDLSSADTLNGVTASDILQFMTAGTIGDAQFTNVASIEEILLSAKSGSYNLVLGSEASASGGNFIDAQAAGGAVSVNA